MHAGAMELAQLFKNLGQDVSFEKLADVMERYDKDESGQVRPWHWHRGSTSAVLGALALGRWGSTACKWHGGFGAGWFDWV